MKVAYLLYKDFILTIKSKFILFFLLSLFAFYFISKHMVELKIRLDVVAEENVKQKIINYMKDLSNNRIIFDSHHPDIVVKLDNQKNYWIVNMEIISLGYLRFIPLLNLMFYKIFFLYNSQVDPIKINVVNSSFMIQDVNPLFPIALLNLSVWGLISFVSNEIFKEKIKRTSLIVNNISLLIFSKALVSTIIFLVVLLIHLLVFGGSGFYSIFLSIFSFMIIAYIYGFLSWVVKNIHFLSILNLSVGFLIMALPFYTTTFILDMNLLIWSVLFILALSISLVAINKNKELHKLVWE